MYVMSLELIIDERLHVAGVELDDELHCDGEKYEFDNPRRADEAYLHTVVGTLSHGMNEQAAHYEHSPFRA